MNIPIPDSGNSKTSLLRESQVKVMEYIENTFKQIIEEIQIRPCGRPKIVLKRITNVRPQDHGRGFSDGLEVVDGEMTIYFPGKNKDEAWRFTCVGNILSEIYSAIKTDEVVTKRDIYYRDPELFRSQNLVDRYVDMVAYTCGVTRFDLNVTASPKGLIAGLHENGEEYELVPDKSTEELYQLVDSTRHVAHWRWILVVEKEATFKTLAQSPFWPGKKKIGRGVVVTGRGYPDLATQRFLRICANPDAFHRPLVLGLFDCDPDGIKIFEVYRNGSKNLSHERAYRVPEMKWLGLKPSDVFPRGKDDSAAIPLTARDVIKIKSMLIADAECISGTGLGVESRLALQWMRLLNRKAEIQILEDRPGGMEEWLMKQIERELAEGSLVQQRNVGQSL